MFAAGSLSVDGRVYEDGVPGDGVGDGLVTTPTLCGWSYLFPVVGVVTDHSHSLHLITDHSHSHHLVTDHSHSLHLITDHSHSLHVVSDHREGKTADGLSVDGVDDGLVTTPTLCRWTYLFLFVLFSLCSSTLSAQTLNKAEYFFDADPGVGNGTPTAITPASVQDVNFAISISSLTLGFHSLTFRFRDNANAWSHATSRLLYITPLAELPSVNLTKAEYFFDTDPGSGNGTPLPITPGSSLNNNVVIDVSALVAIVPTVGDTLHAALKLGTRFP